MSRRTFRRISTTMVVIGLGVALAGPLAAPATAADTDPAADDSFVSLINDLRASRGLHPLTVSGNLAGVARTWSSKMAASGRLEHNPAVFDQVDGWQKLGENVGTGGGVRPIFNALVASPTHLRNMSDPRFTMIGVGSVPGRGMLWTAHIFMRPTGGGMTVAAAEPAVRPATGAPALPGKAAAPAPRHPPLAMSAEPASPAGMAPTPAPSPPITAPAAVEAGVPAPSPARHTTAQISAARTNLGPLLLAALLVILVLGGTAALLCRSLTAGRRHGRREGINPWGRLVYRADEAPPGLG